MVDLYWRGQEGALKEMSKPYFMEALVVTGADLEELFKDIGLDISFNIYDTGAPGKLNERVIKGKLSEITDTMRDQMRGTIKDGIESGWTESELSGAIRDKYNIAQNRADAIARTELGGVINDSREEGFKSVGFTKHSWLSARDGSVRETHQIDGETVKIGNSFSNGLEYPNDPNGSAEEVINCRCVALPEE